MNQEIDLLNIGDTCRRAALPYTTTLKAMVTDQDFPKPAINQGKNKRWRGTEIDSWAAKYKEKSVL